LAGSLLVWGQTANSIKLFLIFGRVDKMEVNEIFNMGAMAGAFRE
jgi:hypothetical protein